MKDNYPIKKCICYDVTFFEMKKIMEEYEIYTLEELKEVIQVAGNCKMCIPYIKEMIRTGKTEFEILKN